MKALVADQECVPAESEVRKRPRMALTNFLKLGKRKECVGCSHALLQAICTYTDRLRHGVSKYLLHIHTCLHTLHEFSASTYDSQSKHSHHVDSTPFTLCLVMITMVIMRTMMITMKAGWTHRKWWH